MQTTKLFKSIYVFNPDIARTLAEADDDKLFFYDGQLIDRAPSNCINVPINTFYEYFLKTVYPQVSQINFEDTAFSDDTQNGIMKGVSEVIASIRNHKLEIINELLSVDISSENINLMLFSFLQYLRDNEGLNEDILFKLLEIINFLIEHDVIVDNINRDFANTLLSTLEKEKSLSSIHLYYALSYIQDLKDIDSIKEEYFYLLANHNILLEFINQFKFIKVLFPDEKFEEYINLFSKYLFKDNFLDLDILEQKRRIFKLYYLGSINYLRSKKFKNIYYVLSEIYSKAIENEQEELAFYLYTPLIMSWDESAPTQAELAYFNQQIEIPLERLIRERLIKKYDIKKNKKVIKKNKKTKVAFLIDRVIPYSIYNVFYNLLESLADAESTRYEFIIYNLNCIELGSLSETVEELKGLGLEYIDLHKEYVGDEYPFYNIVEKALKVRNRLIHDEIDILIGMNSRPEYNFLFTTRTAPKQVYWSHGNYEYDIAEIDLGISHGGVPSDKVSKFKHLEMTMDINKYNPEIDMKEVSRIRGNYPENSFILGTIGRLIKIDNDEYLESVASIMKQNPQTIYLACGNGDRQGIEEKVEKLGIANRFFFTGYIDADIYANVIDLWLNQFPIGGGEALEEYRAKGKPYVDLYDNSIWRKENKELVKLIIDIEKSEAYGFKTSLYSSSDIDYLKRNGYLNPLNKQAQSYSAISFASDVDNYISIAHEFINNKVLCDKTTEEYLYLIAEHSKRSVLDSLYELFEENK